jgi:hypothetical protein
VHAGKVLPANHPVVKARPDGGPYVGLLGRLGPRPGIVLDSDHVAIALVDSLIDRLIQLVEWRKHRRTALLTNLVEPTFAMFEEVHANYLKRFRGYREEIQSPRDRLTTRGVHLARHDYSAAPTNSRTSLPLEAQCFTGLGERKPSRPRPSSSPPRAWRMRSRGVSELCPL